MSRIIKILIKLPTSGVGRMRPASNSYVARQAPRGKKLIWMNNMRTYGGCGQQQKSQLFFGPVAKRLLTTALHKREKVK